MNSVNLVGRLTKEPDIKQTETTKIARFNLAVSRATQKDEADFISCKAFGKNAETVEKWLHKGQQVGISGRIQTGSYIKDNITVFTTDVIVDRLDILSWAKEEPKADEAIFQDAEEDIPF